MKGILSGCVLEAKRLDDGSALLKLAGITPNDHKGVTWILQVKFLARLTPATLPTVGEIVRVPCIATHVVFDVRGQKASRVDILGRRIEPMRGQVEQRGKVSFLLNAQNSFQFEGHLVRAPLSKSVGVTEVRVSVMDRRGKAHYFNCEAWRAVGQQLAHRTAGAELSFTCLLRRDRVGNANEETRVFDIMEVQRVEAASLRSTAQAAD
ncbi:hypothetical protein [Deinococcus ruber]|uniref:Uncharacterized protein n=1 Tax=Deinococcus ruber TaxID=1848197 RepID=A0A918CA98_9DEIO|nr:hypothetical protein [Deinococcus ruber]GGR13080.1 hypothetical protein GCM10008957_27540 [Deinococcus ruber]